MSNTNATTKNYSNLYRRDMQDFRLGTNSYNPGDWNRPHSHKNARFVFVLKGKFVEKIKTKERLCEPFTSIFRPPRETHSEIYGEGVVCLSVDISPVWLRGLEDYSIFLNRSSEFRHQSLSHLFSRICAEMKADDDVSALAIESLLNEVAVEMHRRISNSELDGTPRWIKTVTDYIHDHSSNSLFLSEIAAAVGVHPVHLSRVFRKTHHCTVAEYIRRIRVESAQVLLLNSSLNLSQIALDTGFSDQSHFTRIFKRLTTKTPAQYRKDLK